MRHRVEDQGDRAMFSGAERNARQRSEKLQGRRIAGLCIWGIWLLATVGCAAGPNYHRPETQVPDQWSNLSSATTAEPSITTARQAELVEWWKNFNDPTLTDLVEKAIKANLDVRLAEARLRQARAAREPPRFTGRHFGSSWGP